jgi:hypothetical protein
MKDDMDDLGRIFTCLRALVVRLLSVSADFVLVKIQRFERRHVP